MHSLDRRRVPVVCDFMRRVGGRRCRRNGWLALGIAMGLCAASSGVCRATTVRFVPAADRIDAVADGSRRLVYVSTTGGDVLRYDLNSGTLLSPFALGGSLYGMALSSDGNTLVVADASTSAGMDAVHVVDLPTGVAKSIPFPLDFGETGTYSVAFASPTTLLVTSLFGGSGWVPLRRVDLTNDQSQTVASVRQDTMLAASADGTVVAFGEANISSGSFGVYRTTDGTIQKGRTEWFAFEIGVSRDAGQVAVPSYDGMFVFDGDLQPLGLIGTYADSSPIGVVYSPTQDLMYLAWWGTQDAIQVYDTTTLTHVDTLDDTFRFDWIGNGGFQEGRLRISDDGTVLVATVPGGVNVYEDLGGLVPPSSSTTSTTSVPTTTMPTTTVTTSTSTSSVTSTTLPSPPIPSERTRGRAAVAYQIDHGHTGRQRSHSNPPLERTWSVDLGGPVSYPLIANGRVFVTVADFPHNAYGTSLHALDERTGAPLWGPVALPGTYFWSALAYDRGRVFTITFDGTLTAHDAATGATVWSVALPGQYAFSSAPTAVDGMVFVGGAGSGGTLYAVDEADGSVVWTAPVENGDESSPAVSRGGVYVSYACEQTFAFGAAFGNLLWHHSTGCEGGGGRTPVLYRNRLYVRDDAGFAPIVLDAGSGEPVSTFASERAPAFRGTRGFFLSGGGLEARNLRNGALVWRFTGDGQLASAPIVVNRHVYVGSRSGTLYAVHGRSGLATWSIDVGAPILPPDEHNVSQPLTGLGAGGRSVIVPGSNTLSAYE
jgi:outer membrane protein assembly factor BamB